MAKRAWRIPSKQVVCAVGLMTCLHPSRTFALPPVPVPRENPISEEKRVLGKILFWDEQLSSDNTVACGSCHQPRFGGADGRRARSPGPDGELGTDDDIFGSPGTFHLNRAGLHTRDPIFGRGAQVGPRAAPSSFGGLWAESLFWDGRAGGTFIDPLSGRSVIQSGGALESQAIAPIVNAVEMAQEDRRWPEIARALARAAPLALARKLPRDVQEAIARDPGYPQLFKAAFGDAQITPVRIAFAIATYERTLVADRTPWDDWKERGATPSPTLETGWAWFQRHRCDTCHTPPLFTNNGFSNIGVRPGFEDVGRAAITGAPGDRGRMKVPSLRNAGLKRSFTHTGEFKSIDDVITLYAAPHARRDTLPDGGEYLPRMDPTARTAINQFIIEGLTDPRVAKETYPFDRPQLRAERVVQSMQPPSKPYDVRARPLGDMRLELVWRAPAGGADDYVLLRNGRALARVTGVSFVDEHVEARRIYRYEVLARNAAATSSSPAVAWAATAGAWVWPLGGGGVLGAVLFALGRIWRSRRGGRPDHSRKAAAK